MILLETCVTPGEGFSIHLVDEDNHNPNQSHSGKGCRPTRPWVMQALKQYFGHAYVSKYQPCHLDFDLDWNSSFDKKLHRGVFIGSKYFLDNNKLLQDLPAQQSYDPKLQEPFLEELLALPDIVESVWQIEPKVLLALAEKITVTRPLSPYPGWYFNIEWENPDHITQLRRALWEYFRKKQLQERIKLNLLTDLQLFLYLGNDISSQLFIAGCYEPNEVYFLSQIVAPGMTFLDVGANDGIYSLFASNYVGPDGSVYSFEPSQREFNRLLDNIALNQISNIKALKLALSDFDGTATLKVANDEHAGQNTLGEYVYAGVHCSDVEPIAVKRLDDLVDELGIQRVDVIKLDIEGAEFSALKGAQETLKRFKPLLILELSDEALKHQGSSAIQLLNLLEQLEYEIFTIGNFTGLPVKATSTSPLSSNIIAAHPDRPWNGLTASEQLQRMQSELGHTQSELDQTQSEWARPKQSWIKPKQN